MCIGVRGFDQLIYISCFSYCSLFVFFLAFQTFFLYEMNINESMRVGFSATFWVL